MKNRKELLRALLPIFLTFAIYLVFYSEIESKPTDAGFWMILAMGMSIGLVLKVLFLRFKSKN